MEPQAQQSKRQAEQAPAPAGQDPEPVLLPQSAAPRATSRVVSDRILKEVETFRGQATRHWKADYNNETKINEYNNACDNLRDAINTVLEQGTLKAQADRSITIDDDSFNTLDSALREIRNKNEYLRGAISVTPKNYDAVLKQLVGEAVAAAKSRAEHDAITEANRPAIELRRLRETLPTQLLDVEGKRFNLKPNDPSTEVWHVDKLSTQVYIRKGAAGSFEYAILRRDSAELSWRPISDPSPYEKNAAVKDEPGVKSLLGLFKNLQSIPSSMPKDEVLALGIDVATREALAKSYGRSDEALETLTILGSAKLTANGHYQSTWGDITLLFRRDDRNVGRLLWSKDGQNWESVAKSPYLDAEADTVQHQVNQFVNLLNYAGFGQGWEAAVDYAYRTKDLADPKGGPAQHKELGEILLDNPAAATRVKIGEDTVFQRNYGGMDILFRLSPDKNWQWKNNVADDPWKDAGEKVPGIAGLPTDPPQVAYFNRVLLYLHRLNEAQRIARNAVNAATPAK